MMIGKIFLDDKPFPSYGEVLIYLTFADDFKKDKNLQLLDQKTKGRLLKKLNRYYFTGKEGEMVDLEGESFFEHLIIVGGGKKTDFNLAKWKRFLAESLRKAQSLKYSSVTTFYFEALGKDYFEIGKQLALSFYLANYSFDFYKSKDDQKKIKKIEQLIFNINFSSKTALKNKKTLEEGFSFGKTIAQGIYLTRDLVNQPAFYLHPETLVREAFAIEKEGKGKVSVEVFDEDECKRLGMGAFLAVAQGSERKPKFIILKYQNQRRKQNESDANKKRKAICLIGKSITFDSGGLSLKPSEGMKTMKIDMAGGATVLGVFKILANLEGDLTYSLPDVYGILPACENMPSGKAIKPGDIVSALNGKTIEILNTDAEGRLTLADALSYAEKYLKPEVIIDLATLTGACMVALGKEIAGMFGNNQKLLDYFKKIAQKEGEELWQLPLYLDYQEKLKSEVADLKNISEGGWGGAITAALFLSQFLSKTKWIHLDIAGPAFNEETTKGIIPKGGTGWGVMTLVDFLLNY